MLPVLFAMVAVAIYLIWAFITTGQNFKRKEEATFKFNTEGKVRDVGYIYDVKKIKKITEQSTTVTWWVKIPRTNKIYLSSWEYGYAGYSKDEGVVLVHKPEDDIESDDYNGYIVGLHGQSKGKTTWVWSIDQDELSTD